MKVLLYSKMFPRPGNDSFGSYVYEQVSEMVHRGVEMKIVSPRMYLPKFLGVLGGKFKKYATAENQYTYRGLAVEAPSCLWAKELGNSFPELKYAIYKRSMKKKLIRLCLEFSPDILYGLDPILDGRLCVEVGKELGIPVVLIEHSMPANYRNLVGNSKAIATYAKVVKEADCTIFVTNAQKKLFEKMVGEEIIGPVIYNGFRQECAGQTCEKDTSIFRMISIGFLEDRKGYPTTFKALQLLKERTSQPFHLTILGDGYDRKRYEDMVATMGIGNMVEFKGIVSHKEVYTHLHNSDLFVLPSYEESFGIAYLEAISCGVPVIGTKNEGISDIIQNGKNGFLVEKDNYEELCEIMQYVMQHSEEIQEVIARGRASVENLTWAKNAEKVQILFCNIIKSENR